VVSAIEHPSVLNAAAGLEKQGYTVTRVPVDRFGLVDPAAVEAALTPETALASIMLANSDVGTIEPIEEISAVCRERGVPLHTDAVAAAGNLPVDVRSLGVDALSLAASQFGGPRGAAALFLRKGVRIQPLIEGGVQESGRRAGSENLPGIVGLGKAAALAVKKMPERTAQKIALRDRLIESLPAKIENVILTGHRERRLPHHASFCIEFVEGEAMLLSLDMKGFAVSSGSACTSRTLKASHVLLAMGLDHALAQASLVFSMVDGITMGDIDLLLDVFPPIIGRLREMSPLYTEYLEGKSK
jgi:cysteine desulfurase